MPAMPVLRFGRRLSGAVQSIYIEGTVLDPGGLLLIDSVLFCSRRVHQQPSPDILAARVRAAVRVDKRFRNAFTLRRS
jgi:hypothetical protein